MDWLRTELRAMDRPFTRYPQLRTHLHLDSSAWDLAQQSWVRRTCGHCGQASDGTDDPIRPIFVIQPRPYDFHGWMQEDLYTTAHLCPWCEAGDPMFEYVAVCTPVPPSGWEPSLFTHDVLFEATYGPWLLANQEEEIR